MAASFEPRASRRRARLSARLTRIVLPRRDGVAVGTIDVELPRIGPGVAERVRKHRTHLPCAKLFPQGIERVVALAPDGVWR